MKVEIDLSQKTLRMIQALWYLKGKQGSMEQTLSHLVQEVVKNQIADELGLNVQTTAPVEIRGITPTNKVVFDDPTEISEGLGDDFNYDEQTDPENFVPTTGGLKEEDLEKDMQLEDPQHEAKVEAPKFKDQAEADQNAEETFEQMLIDQQGVANYEDARVQRRRYKNKTARRAKVTAYNGENSVEASL
jgi:hypothetical protein